MKKRLHNRVFAALSVLALLALTTAPMFAGGPLAICQSGVPYRWENNGVDIPFNPDQGDLGPVNNAAAVALVQQAFDVWGAVPTATVSYLQGANLPVDVDITNFNPYLNPVAPDGLSAVVFDDDGQIFNLLFGPGSGVLGFAGPEWANTLTCEIFEGVSFLNGPSFTNATAALDVMVHEFGHWTNLAHTVVNGQIFLAGDNAGPGNPFGAPPAITVIETMYPFYFGPGSGTQTLEADDIATVSALYPDASFAATGSISGTIFAANGTTRLTGVNVIARNVANPFLDAISAISSDYTDSTSQADPNVGRYTIFGATAGASYAIYVDQILAGGFSTPPASPLPGPEEFYNSSEANTNPPDDPLDFTPVAAVAGSNTGGINIIFNQPSPGDPLPVGDDGSVQLSLPFTFCIGGQGFDAVFVNANGNLTFGAASGDFSESDPEMVGGPPRIAGLWDDLNPSAGGVVTFDQSSSRFTAIWDGVPEFLNTGSNSFSITIRNNSHDCGPGNGTNDPNPNQIEINYGDLTAADGIAGLSGGIRITSGFETEIDLSSSGPEVLQYHHEAALYENFSGGDNDLANSTVSYNNIGRAFIDKFEPNNTLGKAKTVSLPFDTVDTKDNFSQISPAGGDVDYYRINGLKAGTTLVAEVLTGQIDSVVGVFNRATGALLAVDDDGGNGFLSRLVFPIPADGNYVVAVSTFPDFDFSGDGNTDARFGQGRYVLDMFTVNGILLDTGDDGSVEFNLGFSFPFQGSSYSSVFVNGNGNLTFGASNSDFSESVAELLSGPPRIAGLWDDLNPSSGGTVLGQRTATSATITYMGVPEFLSTGSNTFAITLNANGDISIDYGAVSALDGLVGVSQGGGAANPGPTDLSTGPPLSASGTTYQLFTAGSPFDLDFTSLLFVAP